METVLQKMKTWAGDFLDVTRRFFNSYAFYVLETLIACLFVGMGKEVEGVLVFAAIISLLLIL